MAEPAAAAASPSAPNDVRSAARAGHVPRHGPSTRRPSRLAAQREDYLLHSMKQYRDNQRTGTDTTMQGVLYGLSDGDLSALAHYLAQVR